MGGEGPDRGGGGGAPGDLELETVVSYKQAQFFLQVNGSVGVEERNYNQDSVTTNDGEEIKEEFINKTGLSYRWLMRRRKEKI